MTIIEAEGLADLGMWPDAWEALEDLTPDERAAPEALRVRLRCCAPLAAWEIGEHVAGLLRDGDALDQGIAAGFFQLNARRLLAAGDREAAADAMKAAVEICPECRLALLDDPALAGLFH